ncbi:hypothetical protein ACJJTC_001540 [Scirpophaga incertulas]
MSNCITRVIEDNTATGVELIDDNGEKQTVFASKKGISTKVLRRRCCPSSPDAEAGDGWMNEPETATTTMCEPCKIFLGTADLCRTGIARWYLHITYCAVSGARRLLLSSARAQPGPAFRPAGYLFRYVLYAELWLLFPLSLPVLF